MIICANTTVHYTLVGTPASFTTTRTSTDRFASQSSTSTREGSLCGVVRCVIARRVIHVVSSYVCKQIVKHEQGTNAGNEPEKDPAVAHGTIGENGQG